MTRRYDEGDFWALVDQRSHHECWRWRGAILRNGYGRVGYQGGRYLAHRLAFQLFYGYLPEVVMHKCDNPPCVNPAHLRAGTFADNSRDMVRKGRQAAGRYNGNAKLVPAVVRQIRHLYRTKRKSTAQLAEVFAVSRNTILRVVNHETWRHVA